MELLKKTSSPKFELSLFVRDVHGKTTTIRKSLASDRAEDIHSFWLRESGAGHKKKRNTKAASKENSEKALKEASEYADNLQTKRDNVLE